MASVVASYTGDLYGSSLNIAISAPSSGNTLLIIWTDSEPSSTINSVTDNGSGSPAWTQDFAGTIISGRRGAIYRRSNVTNSPTNVNVSLSTNAAFSACVIEVTGLESTSPLLDAQYANGTSNFAVVNFTTTEDSAFGIGLYRSDNGVAVSGTNGWTNYTISSGYDHAYTKDDLGTAGTKSLEVTVSGTVDWAVMAAAYKPAGGGPPPSSSIIVRSQRIVGAW